MSVTWFFNAHSTVKAEENSVIHKWQSDLLFKMHVICLKRTGENEVEYNAKAELVAAGKACTAVFWPTQTLQREPHTVLGCQQKGL